MQHSPELPQHLQATLRVLGRLAESLKGALGSLPPGDQPIAAVVIDQLENTLTVVEAAWTCVEPPGGGPSLDQEQPTLN